MVFYSQHSGLGNDVKHHQVKNLNTLIKRHMKHNIDIERFSFDTEKVKGISAACVNVRQLLNYIMENKFVYFA